MQSNIAVNPQSSFSPAPQNAISDFPIKICSNPVPMQWAPVLQALEIEKLGPWSLKAVLRTALTVDPIERVTRKGPTLFFQRLAPLSTAATVSEISGILVPPCPRIDAIRGFSSYSSGFKPASSIAFFIATYANLALLPIKRRDCLGMSSLKSASVRSGLPQTLDLIPSSAYFSLNLIPLLASLSDAVTSSRLFPRQDVIPIPVTTTRRSAIMRAVSPLTACCEFDETTSLD
mmetsp:Transcript_10719/g.16266  ORF Transcript_10719/g.16266 Transcript_10719/m.16266 type:complete len:232 (+) Transcript_10719:786-1481(+)